MSSLVDEEKDKNLFQFPQQENKKEYNEKDVSSSNSDSEIDENHDIILKSEEEPIRDALTGIIPDEWNNIPFPIIDAFKAIIKYLRKQDASMITQQEKHEELVEKHKFNVNRLTVKAFVVTPQNGKKLHNFQRGLQQRL